MIINFIINKDLKFLIITLVAALRPSKPPTLLTLGR